MDDVSDDMREIFQAAGMSEDQADDLLKAAEMLVGGDGRLLVKPWRLTPEATRKALLEEQVSTELGGAWEDQDDTEEATQAGLESAITLLRQGRLIWLDEVPPLDVLERESGRGQQMFFDGFIRHPFQDGYILAFNNSSFNRENAAGMKEFAEVFEKLGVTDAASGHVMVIEPRAAEKDDLGPPKVDVFAFAAMEVQGEKLLTPSVEFIFHVTKDGLKAEDPDGLDDAFLEPQQRLAVNHLRHQCSHMLFYGLMILNTEFVPIEAVPAPEKLNKQRVKSGKDPLPGFTKVHTEDYITALTGKPKARSEDAQGGTHASPVPHLRRGHRRWLDAEHTRSTWVRDSLVNVRKQVFGDRTRSFYDASKLH